MHVMLDIETLGTKPGCVVLQVAMVSFNQERVISTSHRLWNIDVGDQLMAGLEIDPDTVAWWRKQDQTAQLIVLSPTASRFRLREAREKIKAVLELELANERFKLWANPDWFDLPLLATIYQCAGEDYPWPRRQTADARTLLCAAGITTRTRSDVKHYALSDAIAQAWDVIVAAEKLGVDLR